MSVGRRMLERAIECGVESGVKAALEHIEQERARQKKGRHDRRLRNTRLLLQNYRMFAAHAEGAVCTSEENAIELLDDLDDYSHNGELYVESVKRSKERTRIILRHIDRMLEIYRVVCQQSSETEYRRYCELYDLYIAPEREKPDQIAKKYAVEVRTIYKDVKLAIEPLSSLIFGIDSLKT